MQRDAVSSAVESHVERSRGGRNGVNRAAAGGRSDLKHIGEAFGIEAESFSLGLTFGTYKFFRHFNSFLPMHV